MSVVVLLGPQRFRPTVRDAMRSLGVGGPIAVVTAGWQEREAENQELHDHLGCELVDLQLYRRYDDVLLRDRELAGALHARQVALHEFQELYRLRLAHLLESARDLLRREGRAEPLEEHRREAIHALRVLDRRHLARVQRVHDEFERAWRPSLRPAVARHREQLRATLERAEALAIAGGHVAVLLNRLRLFDLGPWVALRPIVAWSAGAMAVSERIVLFHDRPPQGAGNPEVLDPGLGLCRGLLPLPHASRRLRLDDPVLVALFARRFAPAMCAALDDGVRLDWDGRHWTAETGAHYLGRQGRLRAMVPA